MPWFYSLSDVHKHLAAFTKIEAFAFDTNVHPVVDEDALEERNLPLPWGDFRRLVYTPDEFIEMLTKGNDGELSYVLIQTGGADHSDNTSMRKGEREHHDFDHTYYWTKHGKAGTWIYNDDSGDVHNLHSYYLGADKFNNELWPTGNCEEELVTFRKYKLQPTDTEYHGAPVCRKRDDGGIGFDSDEESEESDGSEVYEDDDNAMGDLDFMEVN